MAFRRPEIAATATSSRPLFRPQPASRFLNLPAELRCQIYYHILPTDNVMRIHLCLPPKMNESISTSSFSTEGDGSSPSRPLPQSATSTRAIGHTIPNTSHASTTATTATVSSATGPSPPKKRRKQGILSKFLNSTLDFNDMLLATGLHLLSISRQIQADLLPLFQDLTLHFHCNRCHEQFIAKVFRFSSTSGPSPSSLSSTSGQQVPLKNWLKKIAIDVDLNHFKIFERYSWLSSLVVRKATGREVGSHALDRARVQMRKVYGRLDLRIDDCDSLYYYRDKYGRSSGKNNDDDHSVGGTKGKGAIEEQKREQWRLRVMTDTERHRKLRMKIEGKEDLRTEGDIEFASWSSWLPNDDVVVDKEEQEQVLFWVVEGRFRPAV